MASQGQRLGRIQLNLDTLYDRLCSDEKNFSMKKPRKSETFDDDSDEDDGVGEEETQ